MTDRPTMAPTVLLAVTIGGVAGSLGRYAAAQAWPDGASDFPWTTLGVNVLGCAAMGVLMVLVTERGPVHPLWQPLLGPGLLGGFTTFSAYSIDLQRAFADGRTAQALAYGAVTAVAAVAAAVAGTLGTRHLVGST